jgi:RND family efflux transporter MFP subunit
MRLEIEQRRGHSPGDRAPRGGGRNAAGVLLPVLATILTFGLTACGSHEVGASEGEEAAAAQYAKVVNVEAVAVRPGPFTAYVSITGTVEAYEDVVVSAEEPGRIERFFVEKGARVKAGETIAKIDDASLTAQVDEARGVASLARERFERQRQLWEGEGIGSEIAFLKTKYEAQSAAARLAFLESRLAKTRITSPIAGVLDERYVDAGEIVSPGTPVARVLEIDRRKVVGGVPERYAPRLRTGDTAVVAFDVLEGEAYPGEIRYVGAGVDPRSRTFPIEIVLVNPQGIVKPQMVANVRVATERRDSVIVVPQDVILRTEDGYQVFVIVERGGESVAEARPVRLGPSFENEVVVESGLEPGDLLVVKGHQLLDPGDRARVVGDGSGGGR